jgi:hypothetical protein
MLGFTPANLELVLPVSNLEGAEPSRKILRT